MQIRSVVVVAALGFASYAHGQSPAVQWRIEDGGNGHWYKFVSQSHPWTIARTLANAAGGYLVTLTAPSEYIFLRSAIPAISSTTFWMGGAQAQDSCEPSCGWYWLSGETWAYQNWAAGEPNDEGDEWWLGCYANGAWNDFHSGWMNRAVFEWSADCDGNGVVDYGEIMDGTLADTNANGVPDCCDDEGSCDPCPGDLNASGTVDAEDLAYVLFAWGTDGGKTPEADITRDGIVDANDLSMVLGTWGACP